MKIENGLSEINRMFPLKSCLYKFIQNNREMNQNQLYEPKLLKNNPQYSNSTEQKYYQNNTKMLVCYDLGKKELIPLKLAKYSAKILPGFCIVKLEITYSTEKYTEPIELESVFSINENAAVTKMVVELGEIKVYCAVKEKKQAEKEYQEGLKQGKTMAYSDQDSNFPSIKRVKIGQLAPNKLLKITFEYIHPLEVFLNKFWKFELFPVIDQNYVHFDKQKMIGIHDEELNRYLNQLFKINNFRFEFRQEIQVEIDFEYPITFWKSPTHKLQSTNAKNRSDIQTEGNQKKIILQLQDIPENYEPTKQFTLLFSSDEVNLPRAILSHTDNDALQYQRYCATLTFIPKFNEVSLDDAYTQYLDGLSMADNQVINRGNYLFIIDRSGSMSGSRIKKAKEALILFLRSLPQDSEFNIISFGSQYQPLYEVSKRYTQEFLEQAILHVEKMEADMGGTEILTPLKSMVYDASYGKSKNTTLNVFLLTDGETSADPIIELVKSNNRAQTRIYTLGIGQGCSQYLIKSVAEVGNGKYQIVSDKEDINEKVIDLLEDSLTPYLQAFTLESNVVNVASIIPNPESIVCLKKNQELTIQVLFPMEQQYENLEFKINCFDPQNQKKIQYSVRLNLNQSLNNEYFHKLAAYKLITYYENSIKYNQQQVNFIKLNKENLDQQDIIDLSVQNQILCSKTAFVSQLCDLEDQFKQQIQSVKQDQMMTWQSIGYDRYQNQIQRQDYQSRCSLIIDQNDIQQQYQRSCFDIDQSMTSQRVVNSFNHQLKQNDVMCCINDNLRLKETKQNNKSSAGCCGGGGSQNNYDKFSQISYIPRQQQQQPQYSQPLLEKQPQNNININQTCKTDYANLTYEQLIRFALADGSFRINKEMQQIINYKNLKNHENQKDDVWNTFLALLYLEYKFSQFKKSWQLVYQKGISYLKQNGVDYKQKKIEYLIK
ncbi:unnamed protein product [Paramecium octaurelia]|uniref:Uncharacterized protein n=1 Tax=Paramecium octaurelia TaxID=43137 RepID=A0A8S1TFP3_PAROT|nr:unnamed protein product [Paramecium octaurelia]